jgi:hypothetical protein
MFGLIKSLSKAITKPFESVIGKSLGGLLSKVLPKDVAKMLGSVSKGLPSAAFGGGLLASILRAALSSARDGKPGHHKHHARHSHDPRGSSHTQSAVNTTTAQNTGIRP